MAATKVFVTLGDLRKLAERHYQIKLELISFVDFSWSVNGGSHTDINDDNFIFEGVISSDYYPKEKYAVRKT